MTAIFTAIFLSENPTSIFRSWGRRSWRPKQLRIRLRWVMRCQDCYHGNIPGRFSWVEIWWNFLWLHKKNSRVLLSKKDSKSSEWPCCICSAKTCNAMECWKSRLIWFCIFSCTFWRSRQDDSNMCKHFLWIDGFFLCYILRQNKLLTFGVASSNASTWQSEIPNILVGVHFAFMFGTELVLPYVDIPLPNTVNRTGYTKKLWRLGWTGKRLCLTVFLPRRGWETNPMKIQWSMNWTFRRAR